jgi:hypothetical protein
MKTPRICRAAALALPLLTLMLSGTAGAQTKEHCNAGVCKIDVTVQSCENGTLAASPDPVSVKAPNKIEWTLQTGGYKFPADGIRIAVDDFDGHSATGDGRKFTVRNRHTKLGDHKYAIKVVRTSDNKACKAWDPYIRNE